jgi:hypothetical protein
MTDAECVEELVMSNADARRRAAYDAHVQSRGGPAVPRLEWESGWDAAMAHQADAVAQAVQQERNEGQVRLARLRAALQEIRNLEVFAHHARAHDIADETLRAGAEDADGR